MRCVDWIHALPSLKASDGLASRRKRSRVHPSQVLISIHNLSATCASLWSHLFLLYSIYWITIQMRPQYIQNYLPVATGKPCKILVSFPAPHRGRLLRNWNAKTLAYSPSSEKLIHQALYEDKANHKWPSLPNSPTTLIGTLPILQFPLGSL
ncbi:hypothetical protein BDD12DRAFT_858828 [Trichophaea hybrida]|nr:hypothetical protein BDD12DRAFT_858828 [Trichophaea hybrida]